MLHARKQYNISHLAFTMALMEIGRNTQWASVLCEYQCSQPQYTLQPVRSRHTSCLSIYWVASHDFINVQLQKYQLQKYQLQKYQYVCKLIRSIMHQSCLKVYGIDTSAYTFQLPLQHVTPHYGYSCVCQEGLTPFTAVSHMF